MSQLNGILWQIGEFGPFQRRVYLLLNFTTILRCCQMFLLVFVADKPRWSCLVADDRDGHHLGKNQSQESFPCLVNGSSCENVNFSGEFTSIASEWGLICDQEYKKNFASAIVMAGSLLGAVLFSGMADKRGRKSTIILLNSIASVFCLASGFAGSFEQFVFFRFVTAVMLNGCSTATFVLISETVGQKSKDFLLTAHQAFYAIGYVILSLFAYYVRDWRYLTITVSLPILFSLLLLQNGLCESPLWLVENGRIEESKKLLREIARRNKADISETSLEKLSNDASKANPKSSKNSNPGIFATPGYLKKVVTLSATWLCLAMMYYGLSFISGSLSNNKYLSFSLCGLVEIPALTLSMLLIKSGRKIPLCSLALIGTITCFLCAWFQGGDQSKFGVYVTILALFGKFGIAACYNIIYIFSAEHFGVTVRSFSMGIFSTASSIGGILAPLVIGFEVYDKRIPMVSFGVGAICAAGLVMTLPETLKVEKNRKKDKIN